MEEDFFIKKIEKINKSLNDMIVPTLVDLDECTYDDASFSEFKTLTDVELMRLILFIMTF
jgi:hypothetical protein